MKNGLLGLVFLGLSGLASADVIHVEYSRFYSHVKKLDDEDTNALQFAFGFIHVNEGRLCNIARADIITDKKVIPLNVTPEQRFTVPDEKALKMANAMVEVELDDAANQCDMSVQLETRPDYLKTRYTQDELVFLLDQYRAFFNEMGSFLSFMMPSVQGLMIHFSDKELDATLQGGPAITNGMLVLDEEWIETNRGLSLPATPLRITAKASRN
ncbi:DUF2987 domain-containing protein [Alteromonas sp. CYL-A6]|uniref:DUF2987 domain-containing protein n=1 Tax=Alteromonas nitratireducens TaxID=3390813 RepID=UPI0034B13074